MDPLSTTLTLRGSPTISLPALIGYLNVQAQPNRRQRTAAKQAAAKVAVVEEQVDINANCASGTGGDPNGAGGHPHANGGQPTGAGSDSHAADAVLQESEPINVSRVYESVCANVSGCS